MKRTIISSMQATLPLIILALMIQLSSCGKKNDVAPTPTAQQTVTSQLIANTWKIQSVSVDGIDQTSVYKGLTISFTATSFTTTNGGVVWPASGTWSFPSATDATTMKRDDGILVTVMATGATLQLSLTWSTTTLAGGKLESVKGQNVFNFTK